MTSSCALDHVRPTTLAQLAAELIADHAEEIGPDRYDFQTEAAKNAYSDLLATGIASCGEDRFFEMLNAALAAEWETAHDDLHS